MCDHAILSTLALWKLGRRMLNDGYSIEEIHETIATPPDEAAYDMEEWVQAVNDGPYIGGGYPPTDEPPETALDLYMQAQHIGGFD